MCVLAPKTLLTPFMLFWGQYGEKYMCKTFTCRKKQWVTEGLFCAKSLQPYLFNYLFCH